MEVVIVNAPSTYLPGKSMTKDHTSLMWAEFGVIVAVIHEKKGVQTLSKLSFNFFSVEFGEKEILVRQKWDTETYNIILRVKMMQDKQEIIKEYVDQFSEKQTDAMYFMLSLHLGNKGKGDIMKFTGMDNGVDVARPISWTEKMQDMGVDPQWYVFDFRGDHHGEPRHLLEEVHKQVYETLKG